MNTYLKYQSPAIQFFSFLGLAAGFFILNVIISNYFFSDLSAILFNKNAPVNPQMINEFKWAQFVSATVSFILPAIFFGYFSSPKAMPYVGIQKHISAIIVVLCVVLLVFIQPFVGWVGNINSKMNFGSLQKTLQEAEAIYNRALEVFLQMKTPADLLVNLFIMALLPAIGEELFFRGALQKVILRLCKIPWLSILVSSGIFALLHGTFFKIIPIFALGILLGTVYYFTRNLWYTITIHFLNNALGVTAVYFSNRSVTISKFANDNITVPFYTAILSLLLVIAIMYFIKKKSDEVLPEIVTNEDNDYLA
jgi:membrane protease YdiL (CAAX protease family)